MISRIRSGFPGASMSMFLLLGMLSVSLSFVSSSTVRAEQGSVAKACVADIKEKCGGIEPGEGRVKECIKTHFGDLLTNCKAAVVKLVAMTKSCRSDVKQHCPGVKLGGGRIEACMQSHLADVSAPCKEALGKAAAPKE